MEVILWPFKMLMRLIELIFCMTGRFIAATVGIVIIIVGGILTATFIGAFIGIPLVIVGASLFLRALF